MPLPPFSVLPMDPQGPPLNAWGLWGKDDELGRVNLITADSIKSGRDEIRHGKVVNLKWDCLQTSSRAGNDLLSLPLDVMPMNSKRTRLKHEIVHGATCNDDTLAFNTQTSTQWDGFRHYGYQDWPEPGMQTHYNGLTVDEAIDRSNPKCGTQAMIKHPITSRGVLLDVPRYVDASGQPPLHPLDDTTPITAQLLQEVADHQGVTLQSGDVLCVRTGWAEAFARLSEEECMGRRNRGIGVARGEETLKWHWESGVAAVVSDVRAYEVFPHENCGLSLHEVFLGGWGMPIGELFDLEELGRVCAELRQWTFLFTSMPLYVIGGVASPPNAQAIL